MKLSAMKALRSETKETTVALQEGEFYRCPDESCGCEIKVTKGAAQGHGGDRDPVCCCGHSMEKVG